MIKKLFTGRMTSRKRFAGKSDFSAKQISTTLLLLLLGMIVPQKGWGVATTMNFDPAATAAQFHADSPNDGNYSAEVVMSSTDYNAIGNGAKIGEVIHSKNRRTNPDIDITRLAFVFNSSGVGNADNTGVGFYLRRNSSLNPRPAGLYTGSSGNKLAVLGLKPGNRVTFTLNNGGKIKYVQSVHADEGNGDLYNYNGAQLGSNPTLTINSLGDLIIEPTQGTYIASITIEEEIAEYTIQTNSDNSTEFWFTAPGSLEVNDFAIPYMSVSFGSAKDYLVVQGSSPNDYAAHMFQTTGQYAGTETLSTDANTNWQPSAGNFYAFRPTGGGTVQVSGSLTGSKTHLFVYDPAKNNGNGGWEGTYPTFYSKTYTSGSFSFDVEKDKIYYICIDNGENSGEHSNAFHLHWFMFTPTFRLDELAKVVDLDNDVENGSIKLTKIYGYGNSTNITVKRCTANIDETTVNARIVSNNDGSGYLTIDKPTFASGTDEAGTIILDVETGGGDAAFVVTFPYHADYNMDTTTGRSEGHVWNFVDPRNSGSNIGNCKIRQADGTYTTGTATGILSIGRYKDTDSQFRKETDNREWTYGWTIKDLNGNITDPMYKNVFDMEGDNADMIWETEGLWFENGTNLSCLYNEHDAVDQSLTNPLDLQYMAEDPDRYVGLLSDPNGASSFTIPGLKDGDRVLICMKASVKSGSNRESIFFNIEGARDAVGTEIDPDYLFGVGGTEFIVHTNATDGRYEGFYHFIKNGAGDMKFTMKRGAICKLMYIRIYSGKRIQTNDVLRGSITENGDKYDSPLLFMNEEGDETGKWGWYQLRFRGKGDQMDAEIAAMSGNLNNNGTFNGDLEVNTNKTAVTIRSTVGTFGVLRLRLKQMDFQHGQINNQGYTYVTDYVDRNFTVGYRETYDYPYTWDFTDIRTYSGSDIAAEATNYVESANDYEPKGLDISLWEQDEDDENAYNMMIGNPVDNENYGDIFSQNKNGFGNQLFANKNMIAETRGLWFYMDNNSSKYNGCAQITADGLRFANTNLADGSHTPDWNYKMVVPSVPKNGAVYLRMKRDQSVKDTDISGGTPFLATKFHFGVASAEEKTSVSTSTEVIDGDGNSNSKYSFYQVPNSTDEYILAVMNTGDANHLTFTLNGWIVKKVAVSTDAKTVNRLGWATESRDHVIDPALTSEMTGYPFETYIVTGASYANKTVTLSPVSVGDFVMPIAEDGDKNAYIIRNTLLDNTKVVNGVKEPGRVQILNNGFHLFVPDMHDYLAENVNKKDDEGNSLNQKSENDMSSNLLKALLEPQTLNKQVEGTNTFNYALTSQKNKVGDDTQTYLDEIGFYRIKNGTQSSGNQGYLPVDCTVPTGTTDGGGAKMSIIFDSFDDPAETVETAIEVPFEKVFGGSEAVYYNLNGQKLSGKPTQGGLYIVNGKKVLVK